MATNFENTIPEWGDNGAEPSEDLRTNGFKGGYKPPASVFNWFWSKVQKCITELQTKTKSHIDSTSNPHKVTKAQVGLGSVDNTSDANKPVSTAVQIALNKKLDTAGGTMTGTIDMNGKNIDNVNQLKVDYLRTYEEDCVQIQSDLDMDGNEIWAGNVYADDVTVRSLNGITKQEISYLDGVTSNIQTQLNGKAAKDKIVIAASNTPDMFKNGADYVCTGSNDETVINEAATVLYNTGLGGEIVLLQGTYSCSNQIRLYADMTFKGVGFATVINLTSAYNGISLTGGRVTIRDMVINYSTTGGNQAPLFEECATSGISYKTWGDCLFEHLIITHNAPIINGAFVGVSGRIINVVSTSTDCEFAYNFYNNSCIFIGNVSKSGDVVKYDSANCEFAANRGFTLVEI